MPRKRSSKGKKKSSVPAMFKVPTSGALSCPPVDDEFATKLIVDNNGHGRCVRPDFINVEHKKEMGHANFESKQHVERNDIMDITSPYMVNMSQRNLLSHLLGRNKVSDMEMANALSYAGFLNASCPPVNEPNKTEPYIDLLSGKLQCREPSRNILQSFGVPSAGCPNKFGDPMAIEHYVDHLGRGACRRPVFNGQFNCPTSDNLKATKHVTLPNGTGICVEDEFYDKEPFIMPRQLVYPAKMNEKILDFINVYNNSKMDVNSILRLNSYFRGFEGNNISKLRNVLENDPTSAIYNVVASKIKNLSDPKMANYALVHYFREAKPEEYARLISNPMKYLEILGLSPKAKNILMGGGQH